LGYAPCWGTLTRGAQKTAHPGLWRITPFRKNPESSDWRKKRLLCLGNPVQMIFHDDKSKHGEPIFVLQKLQSVNDDLFGIRFGKNRQPINDGAG